MQTVALHEWEVDNEPDLTREAYALIECGGAEDCGCEACFNFAATRHRVYSSDVLDFLDWAERRPRVRCVRLEVHVVAPWVASGPEPVDAH